MESNMNDGLRRTAYGYTRVSTDEQVLGSSLDEQRAAIQKYADDHNIEILGWYSDPGFSAKTANRPDLKRMLDDVRANKGAVDHIIVYNLSRISRNIASYYSDIGEFLAHCGVTLRSTKEAIDETPLGKFMLTLSLAFHQLDNDNRAAIVKDNMILLARQGWWMSQAPLGLKRKPVVIDGVVNKYGKKASHNTLEIDDADNIGENIRYILNRFSAGDITVAGLLRIAQKLGIKTKNGKLIKYNTLEGILRQPVYAGYNASKKLLKGEMTKIIDFDGLISLETYNKNQLILNGDVREIVPSDNALYPLKRTLICARCGKPIRASAPTTGSGKKSPRYHCCERGHGSIGIAEMHQAYADYLKGIMPAEGTIKLFREILKRTAAKKLADTNRELAKCRNDLSVIDSKLNRLVDALLEGKISQDDKDRYTKEQKANRDNLSMRIAELEKAQRTSEVTIDYVCSFIAQPAKMWKDADLESRQAFQSIMFPNGLHFDIVERKFGTEDLSPLYSVICNKKEPTVDSDSSMVAPTGIEPVTLGL